MSTELFVDFFVIAEHKRQITICYCKS